MSRLDVVSSWSLPLRELSALTPRQRPTSQLLGVGDEDFAVVVAGAYGRELDVPQDATALDAVLDEDVLASPEGSEFEGVAADIDGNVLILQEGAERVLVLTPDLGRVRLTIDLAVDPERPAFGYAWLQDRNSRGEALHLLPNGHLLVAKQREPVTLIEFGPPGDRSLGWGREILALQARFPFPEERQVDYEVLADWSISGDDEGLASINDLAVTDEGDLYALSAKSQRIVRLEPSAEYAWAGRVTAGWRLPKDLPCGEDGKAEGLTIMPGGMPLISIDSKRDCDNVVLLEQLPE